MVVFGEEALDAPFDEGEDFVDGDGLLDEVAVCVEVKLALFDEGAHRFDGVRVDDDFF